MAFNMWDYMNDESKKAADTADTFKIKKLPLEKLHPSDTNFYSLDEKEIRELAKSIELVGLQQNIVVTERSDGEYEIKSGHKRSLALRLLESQGHDEYKTVPCKVETEKDTIKDQLIEIFTNSTQRERSDYEKMQEIERTRELLTELSKDEKIKGRKRDIIASMLGISKSNVGRLSNISKNLIKPFRCALKAGEISTSTANEIAGLTEEKQIQLFKRFRISGELKLVEARQAKEEEQPEVEETEKQTEEIKNDTGSVPNAAAVQEESTKTDEVPDKITDIKEKELVNENVRQEIEQGNTTPQGTAEEQPKTGESKRYVIYIGSDYDAYLDGSKAFVVAMGNKYRKDDIIELTERDNGKSTGRMIEAVVTCVEKGKAGIMYGYSILGIKVISFDV